MPSRFRTPLSALIGSGLLFAIATPALAAETTNSEFVIIREDDVVEDDLYAGAIRVVVEGTLDGDLIAFAAEEVVINGNVTGSVTAVSPRVTINGEVGGSLRATANRLVIAGDVGGDVVAAVVTADLGSDSHVAGELILWAWNADVLGTIDEDVSGTQRRLDLAGEVGGDLDVTVSNLKIVDDLTVAGDLGYRSDQPADGLDKATVAGTVVVKTPLAPNLRVRALSLLGRFLAILFLSIAALTVAYGWPKRTSAAVAVAGRSLLRRWISGALIFFSPLVVIAITGVILGFAPPTAAFPLLAVLVPLTLGLTGIVFALSLVAGAPIVGWLGGVLFKRLDLYGAILVGSLLVGVVWFVPIVGWIVPLLVLPWGLGSWFATWRDQAVAIDPLEPDDAAAAS
jgi:cytoskeletal protein CcmA (bactofilin family)